MIDFLEFLKNTSYTVVTFSQYIILLSNIRLSSVG